MELFTSEDDQPSRYAPLPGMRGISKINSKTLQQVPFHLNLLTTF
jgi:hypothetical protein